MQNSEIQSVADKLLTHLRTEYQTPSLCYAQPIKRLQGGFETASYHITLNNQPNTLPESLVLRVYPERYGSNPATWEAAVQNSLHAQDYPVAQVHHVCTDQTVLGGAFFLMDLIPGIPMGLADPDLIPTLLGTLHAELHTRKPDRIMESFRAHGINPEHCVLDHGTGRFRKIAEDMPWLEEILTWMQAHPPVEPAQLAACHGDFHPMNIMVDAGQVSGVLDWGGFAFADPNYDIGNTLILITIPYKHLAAQMEGIPTIDTAVMTRTYLNAYQNHREIDFTTLDYYQVRRCVLALIQGVEGQEIWQIPFIVRDLLTVIREKTGVEVRLPHN